MAFSFSQINLYQECEKKYRFRYIDKLSPDFDDTIQMLFGTIIHSCLEYLYKNVRQNIFLTKQRLVSFFEYIYDKKLLEIEKNQTKVVWIELKDEYKKIWKQILENFFDSKNKFFWKTQILWLELPISFSLGNVKYVGFIDRIEKQANRIFIVDYKTNVYVPTSDYHQKQIEFYALLWAKQNQKIIDLGNCEFYWVLEYVRLQETKTWKMENIFSSQDFFEAAAIEILNKKWEYEYGDLEIFKAKPAERCKRCEFLSFCQEGKEYLDIIDK